MNKRQQRIINQLGINEISQIANELLKHSSPKMQAEAIQSMASGIEGVTLDMTFDNLLTGESINPSKVTGVMNRFTTYSLQVSETYKKYNGEAQYGNAQVRSIADIRTSFIAGEGMSVSYGDDMSEAHKDFIKDFIKENRLNTNRIMDITRRTELTGYVLIRPLKGVKNKGYIPRIAVLGQNRGSTYYQPVFHNDDDTYAVKEFKVKRKNKDPETMPKGNIVYIRTGGVGECDDNPTTKIGIVLTECEDYDRALKDMRELNYKLARITPTFECKTPQEVKATSTWIKEENWDIGKAFVGMAKFAYNTPGTGAHDNLGKELASNLKTISGTTGVPVHWFGWVDMMSNRSTAEELYNSVYNATIFERNALQDGLKELLIEAQTTYINSGGKGLTEYTDDFEIKLPMIDFGRFKELVDSYQKLHDDEVVSTVTYRNIVPGIDPEFEKEQIAKEKKEENKFEKTELDIDDMLNQEEDDGRNDNETGPGAVQENQRRAQGKT